MPFPTLTRPSPNCDATVPHELRGVVFHHTVITFEETIVLMTDPAKKVSYHCVIAADGTRCTLVPDEHVAWHSGVSSFRGRTGCNAFMLGLSFAGDTYRAPLTEAQLASALEWLEPRWTRYGWTLDWMTDHRQVAPGRKDDLNPVEWERLRGILAAKFGRVPPA
ncbi:MAG TPA: N-acetylmuramoyl-L-alanine amidase [Opitutaceae bacterium]|nr:N-acetylmuramoyl-L-alanine amidase [Opitutaceae bacterium]HND62319.1 N-acetylmuramoyl-L-alanine amidase [Opitutaceae bacterium]